MLRTVVSAVILMTTLAAAEPAAPNTRQLTLREAVFSSAANAGVRLSELSEVAARAGVRIERASLLPQLNAVGSVSRGTRGVSSDPTDQPEAVGPYTNFDGRLHLGQALLDLSAWYRTDAAKQSSQAAMAQGQVALEIAAEASARGYAGLLRHRALVEVKRRDLALAEELAKLAEAQVQAGVAEPINATRALTQVTIARGDLLIEENLVAQAQIDLARALALDSGTSFDASSAFDSSLCVTAAPTDPNQAIGLALRDRPELHAAAAARFANRLTSDAIRGERVGNAQLFADAGRGGPAWSRTETTWTIGVQYTVPIFDGLRREARIEAQDVQVRQDEISITDLKDAITAEVRSALIDLASSQSLQAVAQERVALAEKELGQARDRFRVGVASNLDVIAAQQGLSRASEQSVNALAGAAGSRARLARAVGQATDLR
jgi:outer membrane protein TolC